MVWTQGPFRLGLLEPFRRWPRLIERDWQLFSYARVVVRDPRAGKRRLEWRGNVIIKAFKRPVRLTLLAAIAAAGIGMPGTSASAEGLFGFLFGAPPPRSISAPPPAYSTLSSLFGGPAAPQPVETHTSGGSVAYCVRLCDGRFFPVERS